MRTEKENPLYRIDECGGKIEFCIKTKYNEIREYNNRNNIEWFNFDKYINVIKIISILNEFIENIAFNKNDIIQ